MTNDRLTDEQMAHWNKKCELHAKADALAKASPLSKETLLAVDEYLTFGKEDELHINTSYAYERNRDVMKVFFAEENGSSLRGTFDMAAIRHAEQAKPAEPARSFDLAEMMASATPAAPQQAEQPQKDIPAFMKRSGPDFSTRPASVDRNEVMKIADIGTTPKLATDELLKRGGGITITRTTYRIDGSELVNAYAMNKAGNVVHTAPDGKQSEMSIWAAKKLEIGKLAQTNANTLALLNQMAADPKITARQGGTTLSVEGGQFVRREADGKTTTEPLAAVQQRLVARGREIEAMRPKKEKARKFAAMADRADGFSRVEPKGNATTVEQGMKP